jgi:hypothetical protein
MTRELRLSPPVGSVEDTTGTFSGRRAMNDGYEEVMNKKGR